jgi:outer membrane protein
MKKLFLAVLIATGSFTVFSQVKIAHVNIQKVIDTLPSYKEARKELQMFMSSAEKDLKELESNYEKAVSDYEDAVAKNASQITLERLRRSVQTTQRRLVEAEELWQSDMQKLNNRLNAPILERVQKAIDNVGDRMKLSYILDVNATHYAKGEDITNAVITEAIALDKEAMAKERENSGKSK